MKLFLRGLLLVVFTGVVFSACKNEKTFMVTGSIHAAGGDTLYLEHRALAGVVLLDSVPLKDGGDFRFRQPAPANPEFYQLRLGDQSVAFAVDSSETIRVEADAADLYGSFRVEGSPVNDQMREVDRLVGETAVALKRLEEGHKAGSIDDLSFINELDTALIQYKDRITKLILGNPSGAAAYYALFQKINNFLIFDPYSRNDFPMFGAVATSWKSYYPESERTRHLYEFAMNALKVRKQNEQKEALLESVAPEADAGLPDIVLPEVNGEKVGLFSQKGKVVLLDFTVYNAEFSPKHNMDLHAVYKKFNRTDFEIYQVSFDSDVHFWKTAANNLPWITVRDPQSVNTRLLSMYNVREIPTAFIFNREGEIVARVEDYSQLESELRKFL